MIRSVHVKNFKSIADLTIEPGLVNVLIGANGCGKTNFLEALAFASAAESNKLDNEFLTSRGIRVAAPEFMRSAFAKTDELEIRITVEHDNDLKSEFRLTTELSQHYPRWRVVPEPVNPTVKANPTESFKQLFGSIQGAATDEENKPKLSPEAMNRVLQLIGEFLWPFIGRLSLTSFLVYSPENSALRTLAQEGQILPLGIRGEGLFKLLRFLSADEQRWDEITSNLRMLDWFEDVKVAPEEAPFDQSLLVRDRFVAKDFSYFDQRSANEGFLFLLFYFALIISADTPAIFAIDNVDASLNPKTATALTSRLAQLAKKYNKQVFLTTHSPAVLDGLDLNKDEQRLFVFHRNRKGETRSRRVTPPQPVAGEVPIKLSDAFLRGLLGGLPQNF